MYSPRKDIFWSKDFYSSKKHSDGLELEELELEKLELDFNITFFNFKETCKTANGLTTFGTYVQSLNDLKFFAETCGTF